MTNVLLVLIFAAFLSGCAILERHPVASGLVIQAATLKAIEESGDRVDTARKIVAAAEDAKKTLDFETVTLDNVVAKVRARIAESDRELSEKAVLNALLTIAEQEIKRRVDSGVLDADERQTVNTVLGWISAAAQAYAG